MRNYVKVPCDLYIKIEDVIILESLDEVQGFISVEDESGYELVSKDYFQPSIQVDDNTYLVTLIYK